MSNSVHMINLDHMTRFGWAVGGLVR
ncbi:hypothetical protein BBta_4744 [Bradyrhizobium sp. BTAi1]|nr:hypothetical protein BBta_4744 [Bradyrhizobium sp. BTAi1]